MAIVQTSNDRTEILMAAKQCVCGDREQDYGSPENNFTVIAGLWTDYICAKYHVSLRLNAVDTSMLLSLLKIARVASGRTKRDNFIDLAGYAACGGEIAAREEAEKQALQYELHKRVAESNTICDTSEPIRVEDIIGYNAKG